MVFNKKFHAGSFCGYKASKRNYYDVSGLFKVSGEKTSENITMLPYTLPTITLSTPLTRCVLTFNQGMLPNYTILPAQVCILARAGDCYLVCLSDGTVEIWDNGVLDNVDDTRLGKEYNFFIKNGKPLFSFSNNVENAVYCGKYRIPLHTVRRLYKINFSTRVAQFFGTDISAVKITSGYIDSSYSFPNQNTREYECDIILKVTTGSSLSGQQKLVKFGGFWFGINEGKFAFARLSTVVDGVTATANKTYWFRVMQTGFDVLNYTLLYLEDDGSYTLDTLPAMGQWQIGAHAQFIDCAAHETAIRFSDMANPWGGTINFLNCRACIKYADATSWEEVWHAVDIVN